MFTALTPNTGDTFQVQAFTPSAGAWLEQIFAHEATPGVVRVRSPKMHDNVQNLRLQVTNSIAQRLLPPAAMQELYPQDTITFEATGGAAETDVAFLQLYYADNPGASQRLALWAQVKPRIKNILSVEVAVTGAATLGDWSAGTPINTTFDLLKANTDYAVLGYLAGGAIGAVALAGPDTSNFKVGGPGGLDPIESTSYFVDMSNAYGTPHIPIINSANRGATLAYQCSALASATTNVDFICAELAAGA
ncbi:MAG: hypothetical protein ACREQ5_01625 [Candidatus Dormibacteria bacterium]